MRFITPAWTKLKALIQRLRAKPMTALEKDLFIRCLICGVILTSLVLLADFLGALENLEGWLYDKRVAICQVFNNPPTDRVVHLDIDDRSLDAIGRWPWPRAKMARLIEEISVAKPKAVAIDVVMTDPEPPTPVSNGAGGYTLIDGDTLLQKAIAQSRNVLIAASVLARPTRSASSVEGAVLSELNADLEVSEDQLVERVQKRLGLGVPANQILPQFIPTRREAMFDRIQAILDHEQISESDLAKRLLPHTDVDLSSPILRLFSDQYERAVALRAMRSMGSPMPAKVATLQTIPNLIPLRKLSEAAYGIGFADDNLTEPVVRALPMLVELDNRLYPQLGLAMACEMLDADLQKLKVSNDRISIPSPKGTISIPVRRFESHALEREVPLVADLPWFGTRDWTLMYDWPKHQVIKQHMAIGLVWEICQKLDFIEKNNRNIDQAVTFILGGDDKIQLNLGAERLGEYLASKHPLSDVEAHEAIGRVALDALKDSDYIGALSGIKDLKPEERLQLQETIDAKKALTVASAENRKLVNEIAAMRKEVATAISGHGVLIGWTATSAVDMVTTSIHPRCPGVVVHGVIANAIITNSWLYRTSYWVTALLIISMGMITATLTGRDIPLRASIFALLLAIGYVLLNGVLMFDYYNVIVGAAGPLVAIATVWAGCTLLRVIVEGLERVKVARDLAVFRHEMELAKGVQVALIPKKSPEIEGLEPHGWTKPADLTGGDCFDLWKLPDGRLGILLADASGHGLAPSMIVSQVRTLVRAMAEIETHPHPIMTRVNNRVAQDLEAGRFITAFLGFLSSDGQLEWVSAGHGPILWCSKMNGQLAELESTGMPLGIMDEWAADEPGPPLQLETTGMIVVFSDGIFEAPRPDGEQFGVERVQAILKEKANASVVEIVAAMRDAVTEWQAKPNPIDDQTAVIVRKLEHGLVVTAVKQGQEL